MPLPGGTLADSGGGMDNSKNSLPTVTYCILCGNAPIESQIHNYDSTPIVTYSCVQGGYTGTDTIDADPKFVAAPDSLELSATSPCIDKGASKGAPESDILGQSRPKGAGIDMGAYEYYDGDKGDN